MGHIRSVVPLDGYRLLIELDTGSSVIVDLSPKLKTARFAELASQAVFNDVKLDRETVIWGGGVLRMPVIELINIAVAGV